MGTYGLKDYLDVIIFIDLDETLVYTEEKSYVPVFPEDVHTCLRPHALYFLEKVKKFKLPMYILTAGLTGFQKVVCEKLGIDKYIDDVIGRDEYHNAPLCNNPILIDDRDFDRELTQRKAHAINLEKHRCIKVKPWNPDMKHDTELITVFKELEKMINSSH